MGMVRNSYIFKGGKIADMEGPKAYYCNRGERVATDEQLNNTAGFLNIPNKNLKEFKADFEKGILFVCNQECQAVCQIKWMKHFRTTYSNEGDIYMSSKVLDVMSGRIDVVRDKTIFNRNIPE